MKLAASTGAVCGNGSQYKFFVNRVPNTRNTIIYMEGGGACWDYPSCSGQSGVRGARNPNGVPDNYMDLLGNPGASLVSPFVVRLHPYNAVKTQNWNMVYAPYCTGDVYSGDKVAVYTDPSGQSAPLVWHHNGLRNARAVVAWLRNNLPRPTQMLSTGCSAGGIGSLNNYAHLRRDLAPSRAFLINDSGPAFSALSIAGGDGLSSTSALLDARHQQRGRTTADNAGVRERRAFAASASHVVIACRSRAGPCSARFLSFPRRSPGDRRRRRAHEP